MKKEMSSFDVRSIATELSVLEGSHMDKVYQWDDNVLFRINAPGAGKKDLFFKNRKWLYFPPKKPETPVQPTSFAGFMRKYIDNARVGKIRQIGFDRMIDIELTKADGTYRLIFEIFGGGNVLLVKDGIILNCLVRKTLRGREIRPGAEYMEPQPRFDPSDSTLEEFTAVIKESGSDCVRSLATANLGGQYAEEVCKRLGIDKNMPVKDADDDLISRMYGEIKNIVSVAMGNPEATGYYENGGMVDFTPVNMTIYDGMETKRFEGLSVAMDEFIGQLANEEEKTYVDPVVKKLNTRIEKQRGAVEEYNARAESYKNMADTLYTDYQRVSDLLKVLNEQSQKLTWEKLKEGAMKIPFVRSIDPSKNLVTGTFNEMDITLDYTKGLDANASDLYQKGKDISLKAANARIALDESLTELAKLEKDAEKKKVAMANRVQPTKEFWFERFKWFITSGGRMVLAGRDTRSNDNVVKKHLKEKDVYAHTDIHGAPSTILKEGQSASDEELREVCQFATAQSKGWIACLSEGSAFWVYPDQVSKTPNPGEFVPRGAFIIRGKRNYEYHLPIELAVGEITYQGERKIMCAPESCFKESTRYLVIRPVKNKNGRMAGEIAKRFVVPEEEISRILPPGDLEVVREVWESYSDDEEVEGDNQE